MLRVVSSKLENTQFSSLNCIATKIEKNCPPSFIRHSEFLNYYNSRRRKYLIIEFEMNNFLKLCLPYRNQNFGNFQISMNSL